MGIIQHAYTQTVADTTATSVVRPSDWNSTHVYTMQDAVSLSGNTAGAMGVISSGTVYLAGGNNITLSQNGQSVTISGQTLPNAMSFFEYPAAAFVNTTTFQPQVSTHYVAPFVHPNVGDYSYIRLIASWNVVSTSAATSAGTWTTSFSQANTMNAVIYSQGNGANSQSLQYVTSASAGWTYQASVIAVTTGTNTGGSRWSVSYQLTFPSLGANTQNTSFGFSNASTRVDLTTGQMTDFTNIRFLDIPFNATLPAGNYWIAFNRQSTTAGGKAIDMPVSLYCLSQVATPIGNLNAATNNSLQFQWGLGSWTTNTNATSSSIALASISSNASQLRPYFQMVQQS